MAQFDVYRYAPRGAAFQYVVDVQSKILDMLATREVVPLFLLSSTHQPILILNPIVQINDKSYYLATHEMGAVTTKALTKPVTSLAEHRDEIIAAIDFLTTGV
jgi:toxin CcdB